MKKLFTYLILLIISMPVFAVHDFTINGEEELTVSVSDSLHFEFEFESTGNSADFDFSIVILDQEIQLFSGNYMLFQDGGMLDETGIDGIFSGGFNNFIQLPEGTTLLITLTDEDVSDAVELQFEQLDTDFSISGNVLQEGDWMDFPVMGALVWSVYNGSVDYLIELFENFDLEAFLEFIASDHYLLSDITGLLGTYQIYIPEDIPDVPCVVGVYSALDMGGEFVPPSTQDVIVNGHLSGVNFMYESPDGSFYGIVENADGEPVTEVLFTIENPNSMIPWMVTVNDDGSFSISLINGTYDYRVMAMGYEDYTDSVTINDDDVYLEIVLEETVGEPDGMFYGYVRDESAEPVVNAEIMILPISPPGETQYIYTMADGSFSIELENGTYSYMVNHAWYIGVTGEFEIAGEDVYAEIIMQPVNNIDDNLLAVTDLKAYPNPFNPRINFSFRLNSEEYITLMIYNIRGELVKVITQGYLAAGEHQLSWQGINDQHQEVSSGIYYYHLSTLNTQEQGKILLLK